MTHLVGPELLDTATYGTLVNNAAELLTHGKIRRALLPSDN
jgi:hypothetical protein